VNSVGPGIPDVDMVDDDVVAAVNVDAGGSGAVDPKPGGATVMRIDEKQTRGLIVHQALRG